MSKIEDLLSELDSDKFYTPSLYEFHYNFEFYSFFPTFSRYTRPSKENVTEDDKWLHLNWGRGPVGKDFTKLDQLLRHNDIIRVKYLDQEDLEWLGWIANKNVPGEYSKPRLIPGLSYTLNYDFDKHSLKVFNCDKDVIFVGTIKNKTELERILGWLGIKRFEDI